MSENTEPIVVNGIEFLPGEATDIEGKWYPKYPGVLRVAMNQGLRQLLTDLIQIPAKSNGELAIIKAIAMDCSEDTPEYFTRRFEAYGDASPENCGPRTRTALVRMADTRAKARCLREFIGLGVTIAEEIPDKPDPFSPTQSAKNGFLTAERPPPPTSPLPDDLRSANGPQEHVTDRKIDVEARSDVVSGLAETKVLPDPGDSEKKVHTCWKLYKHYRDKLKTLGIPHKMSEKQVFWRLIEGILGPKFTPGGQKGSKHGDWSAAFRTWSWEDITAVEAEFAAKTRGL